MQEKLQSQQSWEMRQALTSLRAKGSLGSCHLAWSSDKSGRIFYILSVLGLRDLLCALGTEQWHGQDKYSSKILLFPLVKPSQCPDEMIR